MSTADSLPDETKAGFGLAMARGIGRGPLITVCLFLAWSVPSLLALNQTWYTAGVEHGYMLVVMALAIAVRTFRSGNFEVAAGSPLGALVLAGLMLASAVSFAVDVLIVPQFVWPAMVFAAILASAGWRIAFAFLPPLLMLHFTIPIWQDVQQLFPALPTLNEALRGLTTSVVSQWISLTGIPAFIEGNLIALQWGTFEIAEGCSGRSYFLVAVELGLFYGFMYLDSWRRRALLLTVAMGLALAANWLRVYSLILIGYYTEMESPLIADHGTFGWVLFGLVIFPMLFVGRKLEGQEGAADGRDPAAGGAALPSGMHFRITALQVILTLGIVTNLILFVPATSSLPEVNGDDGLVAGYQYQGPWTGDSKPQFVGADMEVARILSDGFQEIGFFLTVYASQTQGSELVNLYNQPLGKAVQQSVVQSVVPVDIDRGTIPVMEYHVDDGNQSRLAWYVMIVAGKPAAGVVEAKHRQLLGRFTGRRDAAALIISVNCDGDGDCDAARPNLGRALGPAFDTLLRHLPE